MARFNATLTALDQATYLGGSNSDFAYALAIHPTSGDVYVAGHANSTDFPGTTGGAQATLSAACAGCGDGFVARLNAALTVLDQATYLGGSSDEYIQALAIHPTSGEVYVTGYTYSTDFPGTTGGAQAAKVATQFADAFVARLNAALTTLNQATYLGGDGDDVAYALAIHPTSGDVYVAGTSGSANFPGPAIVGDAFVARLNAALTTFNQATHLGGDIAWALAIHPTSGDVYVAGYASTSSVPGTTGGAQPNRAGGEDAFVARLNPALTTLGQATYLGGSTEDQALALAIHPTTGDVYVAGWTISTDFPGTAGGAQPASGGSQDRDAFVARLNAALTTLDQATYLGGSAGDQVQALAFHPASGDVYVAGFTSSSNFPGTSGGAQATAPGIGGCCPKSFVARVTADLAAATADLSVTSLANPSPVPSGTNLTYSITVHNGGPDPASGTTLTDTIPTGTTFQSLTPNVGCTTPAVNGTGTITCSLGTIASGSNVVLTLVVKVTAASGTVTNTVSVATVSQDPTSANNSATSVTTVTAVGAISGTVCANAGPPCVAATNPAISGALIIVRSSDSGVQVATGSTNASGTYTIASLPPRNYKVSAEANGFAIRYFNNQIDFNSANLVTVSGGSTTGSINFGLPANAGGITGKVTLIDGVTAVAGASISVRAVAGNGILYSTTTDAFGNYNTQPRLAAGTYIVRVTATGFPVTYYDGAKSVASATPVAVNANANTPNINVKLSAAAGAIRGTVTSAATGAPQAEVGISVWDGASGGFIQGYTTNNSGVYDTGLTLAPGQYKVTAQLAGSETIAYNNKFSVATGDPVTVTADVTTTGIDIALPLVGGLTGHVTNVQTSAPLSGANVTVSDYASNNFVASTTTAPDGSYTINGLNPLQSYRVLARLGGFGVVYANNRSSVATADAVTVPAGSNTTLDFALAQAGGITGRVTDAVTLAGIQGIIIDVFDGVSTAFPVMSDQNLFSGVSVTTGAGGDFNTGRVLAPGIYKVRARFGDITTAYIPKFYVSGLDLTTATPVTVAVGADTPNVDVVLSKGGTITGTIRDRASGQPISGAGVSAQRFSASVQFLNTGATTNANGNYTISGLTPGEWVLAARATGHIVGWFSGDPNNPATDFSSSTPIQIPGTTTFSNGNINLQLGGGTIQGRVTRSDNGQPVPVGTTVTIRGPVPRTSQVSIGTGITSPLTDAQGGYSLPGLAPGRYVVQAFGNQTANGTTNGFFPLGAISRGTGVPVTVTDGNTAIADFQVPSFSGGESPRIIRGTLRDPSNNPIREAFVFAYEPTALTTARVIQGFDDGSFALGGLPPGRYIIAAQTEKTFVSTTYPAELSLATGILVDVTGGDVSGINLVLSDNAGTVAGTVTRSDSGQPVLGALISVRTFFDAPVVTAVSRVDGTYLARGLAPGFYKIRVSAAGFTTKYFSLNVPGGVGTHEDGSYVDVAAGTNTPGINLVLTPTGAVLTGTVKRQGTLEPVSAAVVAIHDAASGNRVMTVNTDASGTWRSEDLAPGSYTAEAFDVQAARYAAQWYSGKTTSLNANPISVAGVTSGIDFLVSAVQGSISGRVFMSNGTTPLANAGVEILDAATGGLVRRTITGSDGRYSVQGLAPGTALYVAHAVALGFDGQYYALAATRASAATITVTSGGDTPNINFILTQPSTADVAITKFANPSPVLSGSNLTYTITVSNAGPNPASNASLLDTVPTGTTFQSLTPSAGCTTPAVNGTGTVSCTIGTLASGGSAIYTLVVKVTAASGSVSNTVSAAAVTPDPSSGNNTATATTSIVAPGAVSGTVCANAAPPCGVANPAILGALITIRNSDIGITVATGSTDTSGTYLIGGLSPRNYKVSAEANDSVTRFFNNQATYTSANLVTVNAGATTGGVNFGLPGNAGGIKGRITLSDGLTPVPGATVLVRTVAGDFVLSLNANGSGNYDTQRRLGAGTYIVRASTPGSPLTYYVSANSVATATPIAVGANADTTGIDIKLAAAAGGISGQITSAATGAPLASVNVSIFDGASSGFVNAFATDATGHYDTGQTLAPGQYKVTASIAGSETVAYNNKFSVATGDPVIVTASATTTGINVALPLLGGITGHVRNSATSAGIGGAIVDVFDFAGNNFITSATTATTGDIGSYTINNLNPLQAYRVRGRATNFGMVFFNNKPSAGTSDVVTVPAGSITTVDFSLVAAGGITGTVRDAVTLVGIPSVNVDIIEGSSTNFSINNFMNFSVATDGSGNFNIGRILAPGVYKLRARKFNSGYIQTFYPNGFDLSTAATLTVTAGADTLNANISMSLGGTITGTIRDRASNQPISGATVIARRFGAGTFFGDFTVTTDASGNYTITGLHPGEWLITGQATGHILGWYSGNANNLATDFAASLPIAITGTNIVSGVNMNLAAGGGEIRGRVTRSDNGQPVRPGISINIRGPWPRAGSVSPASVLTNQQGDYSFPGLAPGRYWVEANRAQVTNGTAVGWYPFGSVSRGSGVVVTVTDGGVTTTDFQVLGFGGGDSPRAIRGTLRNSSNQPIREARVFAIEPHATGTVHVADVFDDGSFVVDGLAPGRYALSATIEDTYVQIVYPAELTANTGALIDVTAGDAAGITFVLPNNAGSITGTVTRSDNGQPILGASISVRTFLDSGAVGATSRVDGSFLVRSAMPGFYKIRVSAPGFVTKYFKVGVPGGVRTSEEGSFVTVTGGANTPNINVALDPTAGALTGTVRDQATLEPVVATVAVIHDAATGNRVQAVSTDAAGAWRTEGLGPGSYKVGIFDVQDSRHAGQWYSGKNTLLAGDAVPVAAVGVTGGVDVLVSTTQGSISGRLFQSDGETPLPNAVVSLIDAATGGTMRSALASSDGRYVAQGLPPGTGQYVARARALGFADQFYSGKPARTGATALSVTNGVNTPNISFALTQSSDITGAISYNGNQSGALRVRLFTDAALTQQVYETVIASPTFEGAQTYGFRGLAPDTRGLQSGTYYVKAFLDTNGNGFQDATEAFGQFGAPDAVLVLENATVTGKSFSIADPPATTNTPPTADAQTVIFVQGSSNNSIILTGADAQTATANLTYSVVSSPAHGTITATETPQQRLYTPAAGSSGTDTFTFTVTDRGDPDACGTPSPTCSAALTSAPATVTIQVNPNTGTTSKALSVPFVSGPSTGVAIGDIEIDENAKGNLQANSAIQISLPAGVTFSATPVVSFMSAGGAVLNAAFLNPTNTVLSFTLGAPSTSSPTSIRISGMFVNVSADFLQDGITSAALLAAISGPNPGLTPASVQNATVVTPAAGPAITDVSPTTAAQGASGRVVVITGANFDVATASVSFGSGGAVSTSVDSSSQITATLAVSPSATLGSRDVTVTNGSSGLSATKTGAFTITAPPTISLVAGPNTNGSLSLNLFNQLVTITGTNFESPTSTPSNLVVQFGGVGVTVVDVGYTNPTTITAYVNVDQTATVSLYNVTVINPDGGSATGTVSVEESTGGSAPPGKVNQPPPPPPPPPAISTLTPNAAALGSNILVNGSGFSATASSNSVTFASTSGGRIAATVVAATTTQLTVTVPSQAAGGNVTVAVNGVLSNGVPFSVTNPVLSAVLPTSGSQGAVVALTLTGLRFQQGASVSFSGALGDITMVSGPIVSPDGTSIQVSVSIASGAALGARDVRVTNPDGTSSTLAAAFQVQAPIVAGFLITLPAFPDTSTYLPSVDSVAVTRAATGLCTAKTVVPTPVTVQAQFTTVNPDLTAPANVTFTIVSSTIPGTASNETCEVAPFSAASPSPDWSIGAANVSSQSVVVAGNGGVYTTTLYSYDWGGKVTITVTGVITGGTATGSLGLPVDADGDDLPDAYEKNAALNADKTGANVLNFQNPDQDGNLIKDRDDRFARDGLTNFEKYRGVYLVGPIQGASGTMSGFQRLGAGLRHLFVRGRGFRDDPAVPAGFCGINPTTGAPVADPSFCPALQIGAAFQTIGVSVHNVSGSFTATTELPRTSYTNATTPTLDLATVIYDGVSCKGTEACDTTSKFGVRQWGFNTLGYTTPYGTVSAYGVTTVYKRAVDSYFNTRPYQHRINDPARVVTAPDGTPMLAPITKVGDSSSTGADNGLVDSGDGTVSGQLAGDVYVAGSFTQQLSALDANNDGCIEMPTVADPTTIERCNPTADSAVAPSATKQQVVRSIVTHELGHLTGVNTHTSDATDIMYMSTINFTREDHFSDLAAGLVQIHNKGLQ